MRRALYLVTCTLFSCGPADNTPVAPHLPGDLQDASTVDAPAEALAPPTPTSPPAAPADVTVEVACSRVNLHRGNGCAWALRFPPQFTEGGVCERSLTSWIAPGAKDRDSQQAMINCWALDCAAAQACMVRLQSQQAAPAKRSCGDEGNAPIEVDAAKWTNRRGRTVVRFSKAGTSVAEPLEVCGIGGEVEWMMRAECNDGSHPYASPDSVNDGRDSWLARGGRCNSVLDRYSVKCPEATYTIHIDRYVCPQGKEYAYP